MTMYFTTYLSKYPPCKNGLTQHNNASDAHQGLNFFTKLFVDITHTHTSNILAFGGTGSPRGRVTFSGYLHMDSMRFLWHHANSEKHLSSKIFSNNFEETMRIAIPLIPPKFHNNQRKIKFQVHPEQYTGAAGLDCICWNSFSFVCLSFLFLWS